MRSNALAAVLAIAAAAPCQTFFPPAPTPPQNPLTTQKALLGFVLFHEEQLSSDNTVACRSCHQFPSGGADSRVGSSPGRDGAYGTADDVLGSPGVTKRNADGTYQAGRNFAPQVTTRKAPSMINVAYAPKLFWDGRAVDGDFRDPVTNVVTATGSTALENLIKQPPVNPVEMGHPGRTWTEVVAKIQNATPLRLADQVPARISSFINGASYPTLFQRAFGTPEVNATRIVFAIASYMRTLVSDQSRYDYAVAGALQLTAEERLGQQIFETTPPGGTVFGGPAACQRCHSDVSMNSHSVGPVVPAITGYYQTPTGNFHNTGVRPITDDAGLGAISGVATDNGRFKTPFLRNIGLHPTYAHTGQMATLADVVDFYSRGGDFHVNQAPEIVARNFTPAEKTALVAFLNSLTDPRVVNRVEPFDTVRLASERNGYRPTQVGTASGSTQNAPVVVTQEPAFLGNPKVTLGVHHVPANQFVALLVDVGANPTGVSVLGTQVYLSGVATTVFALGVSAQGTDGAGYYSTTTPIPNVAGLAGTQIAGQWFALDPTATGGITASAGFAINL